MAKSTRRLTNLMVKEVSLVRQPANQGARVLFTKSGGTMKPSNTTAAALAGVAEGFRKAIEAVEVDDPQARSAAISDGIADFQKALASVVGAPVDETDDVAVLGDVAKALSAIGEEVATVKAALAKSVANEQAVTAALEKIQKESAEKAIVEEATELAKGLVTTPEEIATVLRALPEGPAREAYKTSLAKERAASGVGALTKTLGSTRASAATDAQSAAEQLETIAKGLATSENVPMAKALEIAMERNPELYHKTIQS